VSFRFDFFQFLGWSSVPRKIMDIEQQYSVNHF
jgi:hypothetical protein